MPEPTVEVEAVVSRLASGLFTPGSVQGTLQRVVDLASDAVDGCDAAGVLVFDRSSLASTAAQSDPFVLELDRLQIAANEGPCLDAGAQGSTFYATDLLDDERWPVFGPAASEVGVRSVIAYPLGGMRSSALNLYSRLPAAFGATDRAQGQLFATLASVALTAAEQLAAEQDHVGQLTQALETRGIIGRAQGILMERERITADQAFDVLRRASQRLNVKLRDVASDLVDTGEHPGVSPTP